MLDREHIWVIFYSSSKRVIKQQRQLTTSTMHLAQELLMNVQCISGSGSFAKETRALKIRSISQFSHSVVSDSLWPHGLQHSRLPCPAPTTGACSNSCPSSQWCHPTISSSVVPFSSHLQSFPASGSFQMSQFFASRGQGIGVAASASVLPMNIQNWFPLG